MCKLAKHTIVVHMCEERQYWQLVETAASSLPPQPENIMLLNKHSQRIKLIDFGLAQKITASDDIRALMGTAEFVGRFSSSTTLKHIILGH